MPLRPRRVAHSPFSRYRAVGDWHRLPDTCTDIRLEGVLQYRRLIGATVALPFAAALAHVFNQAIHHRGQVGAALTALGRPASGMHWVYALQEMTP